MAMLTEKQLAERGALSAIKDLRAEIERIQTAYPAVVQAERVEKMKATVAAKGGGAAKSHKAKDPNAPKKSHKKKVAPVAANLGGAVAQAVQAANDEGTGVESAGVEVEAENEAASV